MKRALAFTLMVLAIMIIAVSCEEPQAPHEHTYAEEWSHDDTFHWHASACGHEEEVSDKEAHKWNGGDEDGWIVDVDSTEKEQGKKHRECSVCGYKEEGKVPLKGHVHTFSAYDHTADKHWRTCTGCGEKFTYTHTFSYVAAGALEHTPTCYCGYEKSNEAHSYSNGIQKISGETVLNICDKCDYEKEAESTTSPTEVATAVSVKKIEKTETVDGKEVVAEKVNITVDAAAATTTNAEGNETTQKTSVTFPIGALKVKDGADEVSLIVNVAPAAVASSTDYQKGTTIITSNDETVIAGFEFKLEGADSYDLDSKNGKTTVTTFIAKGLDGTSASTTYTNNSDEEKTKLDKVVKIKYIGSDEDDAEITSYNNGTGALTFTVNHFSKYAILAQKDFVAVGDNGRTYTLDSLIVKEDSGMGNGNENTLVYTDDLKKITLLKDIIVDDYIRIKNNVELNGNNHTLKIGNKQNDYGNSGLFIAGQDIKVTVKNITLEAGSEYKADNALVYVHHANKYNDNKTDLTLENVIMNCNPNNQLTVIPNGVMTTSGITGKIKVKGCTINNALHGMYFNSIKTGEIKGNTINKTRKSGINIADVSGTESKADVIYIEGNTLEEISSLNDQCANENCGIYVGDIPSTITLGTNEISLAETCTNGAKIIYSEENITTAEKLKTFLGSEKDGTAYLNADIKLTEAIESEGTKILNLCGRTLETSNKITNTADGNLTIENGTIKFEITPTTSMHAFNNRNDATFTASSLTLDITFKNDASNTGDLIGFYNQGKAVISKDSKIFVKCGPEEENGNAGKSKIVGVFSHNSFNDGMTIDNSTVEVDSSSGASSYGFYMYLSADSGNAATSTLSNSTVKVTQSTVGSVSPVFAESYHETYQSRITITGCKTISGTNTIESNKSGEDQKYVYAVRAKGNGVIDIDSTSAAVCRVTSTDGAGAKNILEKETLRINNSDVTGTINENYNGN